MHIFAGSYERFIFGYSCPDTLAQEGNLVKAYTLAAHKNAVKCLTAGGGFLVSGGADDTIRMYDLAHDKDLGFLMNPAEGAVPCLELFTPQGRARPSHLFAGSADGAVVIWKAGGNWDHLKTMPGHKAGVNSLTVHHSGKLALSTARDKTLKMWDLIKGRFTYTAKLDLEGDIVRFLPSGNAYALVCGSKVTAHSTAGEGSLLATFNHDRRVLCMTQQHDDVLLAGTEDGGVRVCDMRTSSLQAGIQRAHGSRVRGMAIVEAGSGKVPDLLATASSDGVIKVWDSRLLSSSSDHSPPCLAEVNTRARLTCLTSWDAAVSVCTSSLPAAVATATPKLPEQSTKAMAVDSKSPKSKPKSEHASHHKHPEETQAHKVTGDHKQTVPEQRPVHTPTAKKQRAGDHSSQQPLKKAKVVTVKEDPNPQGNAYTAQLAKGSNTSHGHGKHKTDTGSSKPIPGVSRAPQLGTQPFSHHKQQNSKHGQRQNTERQLQKNAGKQHGKGKG